jgi:hypothetical protein
LLIAAVTKFFYRWHTAAGERSDLKFFMFRIDGSIYPASLIAFRKLIWEIKGFGVAHAKIMGTVRMPYCRGWYCYSLSSTNVHSPINHSLIVVRAIDTNFM